MNDSVTKGWLVGILPMYHHFKIMKIFFNIYFYFYLSVNQFSHADRIKDWLHLQELDQTNLVGYGLVIGLAKTGDGSVNLTKQSIAAMISQFGVIANTADIDATNSANVMVTAANLTGIRKTRTNH